MDRDFHFSLLPPENWLKIYPHNYLELQGRKDLYLPKALIENFSNKRILLFFVKKKKNQSVASSIQVISLEGDFPRVNKNNIAQFKELFYSELKETYKGYSEIYFDSIQVDGIGAIRIVGVAGEETLPESERLIIDRVFMRGYQSGYVLNFFCPAPYYKEEKEVFDSLIESFRVLKRPSFF